MFFFPRLLHVTEAATGKLLDLAEGANMAQVHSGTKQAESDSFMEHNHATENNNTVWVRQKSGCPVCFSCSGLIRKEKKDTMQETLTKCLVMFCTCSWELQCCCSELDNSLLKRSGLIKWSHSWSGCGAASSLLRPLQLREKCVCKVVCIVSGGVCYSCAGLW